MNQQYWLDPDTLMGLADGSTVEQWTASRGTTVAGQTLNVSQSAGAGSVLKLTDASGHVQLYFNGSAGLGSNNLIGMPTQLGGYSDLSVFKITQTVANVMYTMTRWYDSLVSTTGDFRMHFGIDNRLENGVNRSAALGVLAGQSGMRPPYAYNSVNLNNWAIENVYGVDAALQLDVNSRLQYSVALNSSNADGGVTVSSSTNYTPISAIQAKPAAALYIGGTLGVGGTDFTPREFIIGFLADQIAINGQTTAALRQEISAYTAAKYQASGQWYMATVQGVSYDLSTSSSNSDLIDQGLLLNNSVFGAGADTVTTAGSDYVCTGSGNDLVKVKDLYFRTLDGGLGRDTWALDAAYAGASNIVLADFVSNARGMSGDTAADTRVNAAGFHKLQGFEAIDTSTSAARQVLTVTADDVNQLSETNTLEVRLGGNDVLLSTGLGSPQHGLYKINGHWYDSYYSAQAADGQALALYSAGGDQPATLNSIEWNGSKDLLQISLDHAMTYGTALAGHFAFSSLGAGDSFNGLAVATINQRQGLQFAFPRR